MNDEPSPNRANGRRPDGRFAPGYAGGPGNPFARRVAELRSALMAEISPEDVRAIVRTLINSAKTGDIAAAKEILMRACGRAEDADQDERLAAIEAALSALREQEDHATART